MIRLAVVLSHPIQYYAPWFRQQAQQPGLLLQIFCLWDFGVSRQLDRGSSQELEWDVPLLDGYAHTLCPIEPPIPAPITSPGCTTPAVSASCWAGGLMRCCCLATPTAASFAYCSIHAWGVSPPCWPQAQLATNPRLVKEADAFSAAVHHIEVITGHYNVTLERRRQ